MEDKFDGIMAKINMLFASGIAKSLSSVVFNQLSLQPSVTPGTAQQPSFIAGTIQQPLVTPLTHGSTQQPPVTQPTPETIYSTATSYPTDT